MSHSNKQSNKSRKFGDALVWGGGLILIGLVLLLDTFRVINYDIWNVIGKSWPIFIVWLGLDMLFGKTRRGDIYVAITVLGLFFLVICFGILSTLR